jgi:radical SAM superfamily enzyme YgiQ (UPF0313 family)
MQRDRVEVCQFDGAALLPALPLAAGLVVAAARSDPRLRRAFRFGIHTDRADPTAVAGRLAGARVAAFSCYSWNLRYSLEVARRLHEQDRHALVVLGGPSVPRRLDRIRTFLDRFPDVDFLVLGEGEPAFPSLLRALLDGEPLDAVPSLAFRAPGGRTVVTERAPRIRDFADLESPYLDGTFDRLIAEAGRPWAAVIETNRGCPFSCSFCDWGQAVSSRVHELPLDRVHGELEWIAARGVPYLYIVDANFGIRPRDPGITRRIAELYERHGAPAACHFHLTKNATERNLATVATLRAAGVQCQVAISMQDTDEHVLAAIHRSNIRPERALALRKACNDAGIPTFNELLLGLPEQTSASIRETLTGAVSPYPGDSFFVYPLRILENADLGLPEEIERHGLATLPVVTGGGGGIDETEDLVVATRTLPRAEWLRAWRFSQLLGAAYNLRWLHLLVHHIRFTRSQDLSEWIDHLLVEMETARSGSALAALEEVLDRHGAAILSGRGFALPTPGFGDTPREAHEALALTALAAGDRFWSEIEAATNRWCVLDAERVELFAYQRFITPGPGAAVREESFDRDWLAWDAARGNSTGGPDERPVLLRRTPPPFVAAGGDVFAAGWLHTAYAKSGGTSIETIGEPARM